MAFVMEQAACAKDAFLGADGPMEGDAAAGFYIGDELTTVGVQTDKLELGHDELCSVAGMVPQLEAMAMQAADLESELSRPPQPYAMLSELGQWAENTVMGMPVCTDPEVQTDSDSVDLALTALQEVLECKVEFFEAKVAGLEEALRDHAPEPGRGAGLGACGDVDLSLHAPFDSADRAGDILSDIEPSFPDEFTQEFPPQVLFEKGWAEPDIQMLFDIWLRRKAET